VNKQIIDQIQRRRPDVIRRAGPVVGMAEAAVRQRVQRMIDSGVIVQIPSRSPIR